ncbi:MAG: hypothetical protein OXC68_13335 [Aestuariivita sp.]|nr:hypothetical protein [Aestuariivita sp.]
MSSHYHGNRLPLSDSLDIGTFAGVFNRYTNSYKFLFFRTLMRKGIWDNKRTISFRDIETGMIEEAWWPGFHFRLSFGCQDKVIQRIEDAGFNHDNLRSNTQSIRSTVDQIVPQTGHAKLLRFVPYAFLKPWFPDLQPKLTNDQVYKEIAKRSQSCFDSRKPLYRINFQSSRVTNSYLISNEIEFHHDWYKYLSRNRGIIQGWSDSHWLRFLEGRNPNVPSLSQKISMQSERQPFTYQRKLWKHIIEDHDVFSIYSGKRLQADNFDLDHFLPWSFVTHDRFWNLTPIEKSINSEKSDRLPPISYIPKLANQHSMFAQRAKHLSHSLKKEWKKVLDDYAIDLRVEDSRISDPEALKKTYVETFSGLRGIAKRMGFQEWYYQQPEQPSPLNRVFP